MPGKCHTRMAEERRTVIVVDDSDEVREVLTTLLEDQGFRVLPVEDGTTALLMTRRIQPALVTLDLGLPREDGREILRRLKADPTTAAIPVLVVSGRLDVDEETRMLGAGGVLHKPFELDEVERLVTSLVRRPV